jgi:hypothetical protein
MPNEDFETLDLEELARRRTILMYVFEKQGLDILREGDIIFEVVKKLKPNPRIILTFPREQMRVLREFAAKHQLRIAEVIRRGTMAYIQGGEKK